jgi:hypothetical protein
MLFDNIQLFQYSKKFLFVPKKKNLNNLPLPDQSLYESSFEIDRVTGNFSSVKINEENEDEIFKPYKSLTLIYGILGIIDLLSGPYLIIILKREFVGYIKQHKIYRIKKIQAIPFTISKFYKLEEENRNREVTYIEMLSKIFIDEKSFYYSYTLDITKSLQNQLEDVNYLKVTIF